jgi:lipopolysaccharide heptosyltransferase II
MKDAWREAKNLLCVRLDNIGDLLMTTPALRALKASAPGRRITLLTSPAGAQAAAFVREIDQVIVFDAPWMKATPDGPTQDGAMIVQLAARGFDAAVIFTAYSQSPLPAAYLAYLAGIPLRLAHCHENPYRLLSDWVPDPEPGKTVRHEVRRQLDLVASVGCHTRNERLSFAVPRRSRERVQRMLAALVADPAMSARPLVLAHPGASAPSRRYPPESFARALDLLARDSGCEIVFTGAEAEAALIASIQGAMMSPSHSLAGRLELAELGAAIAAADLLVCNNAGPAHIAAALGTPVVDLYALTNPQHTPWKVPSRVLFHDVPCRYCYKSACPTGHHDCLRLVAPETVAEAAQELLAATQQDVFPLLPSAVVPAAIPLPPDAIAVD